MPDPASPPRDPHLEEASRLLGEPVRPVADLSWPHAESAVRRVAGPTRTAVLKVHRTPGKARRERAFYERVAPRLGGTVPRLLAFLEGPPAALLLDDRPGRAGADPAAPDAPALHRAAGAWLARLHGLACEDRDPLPLEEAYARRAEAWFARAAPHLPGRVVREARARVEEALPALRGRARAHAHRDFSPRNWLAAGGRLEAVIDFEHARPDLPETDLVRLALGVWAERPGLRAAFLEGYGAEPPPTLPALAALEAVANVAWAEAHDDAAFAAAGRAALARLLGTGAR